MGETQGKGAGESQCPRDGESGGERQDGGQGAAAQAVHADDGGHGRARDRWC